MLIFFWYLQEQGQPAQPPAPGGDQEPVGEVVMRLFNQHITINSGATVSNAAEVRGSAAVAIWAPIITGSQINLLGSWDDTSANFVPITNPAGSGTFFWTTQGSAGIVLTDVLALTPFRYFKLQANVAQTDIRSFAILSKF